MSHRNQFVSFLRSYGPSAASDAMYDELISDEIDRFHVSPPIEIKPSRLDELLENFESKSPTNVILTGTAGDGKTYHCRCVWEKYGGAPKDWSSGKKVFSLILPESNKKLTIVKDLSELTIEEKEDLIPRVSHSICSESENDIFLIAANDGQLIATWRQWKQREATEQAERVFSTIEDLLVEGHVHDSKYSLDLYNLSEQDVSERFQQLTDAVVGHEMWSSCEGCELFETDGTTRCPIRVNRSRIGAESSLFRQRLGQLMVLAGANQFRIPIRDLLLLITNILLGVQNRNENLMTCSVAKEIVSSGDYPSTNPYDNVFGSNLDERERQQYQIFNILESFGVGRETDNRFDNMIIYGTYDKSKNNQELPDDEYYGTHRDSEKIESYLEDIRKNLSEFMTLLKSQRRRLFFSLEYAVESSYLNPWRLTVFQTGGRYLELIDCLRNDEQHSEIKRKLITGLNRTFCGMMTDEDYKVFIASSGGTSVGRVSSELKFEIESEQYLPIPYLELNIQEDQSAPNLQIIDPTSKSCDRIVESMKLMLTNFEFLIRVADGALPSTFSRQCNEEFFDFKNRLIESLSKVLNFRKGEIAPRMITEVNKKGKIQSERLNING